MKPHPVYRAQPTYLRVYVVVPAPWLHGGEHALVPEGNAGVEGADHVPRGVHGHQPVDVVVHHAADPAQPTGLVTEGGVLLHVPKRLAVLPQRLLRRIRALGPRVVR